VADTDYQQPVTWGDGLAYSAPTANIDYNATNLKITATQIDTIQSIAAAASPTFAGLTDSGLTASRLLASDGAKLLVSVADLASWIAGTANQVVSTSDGDGSITLSLPQSIDTAASITLGNVTLGTGGALRTGTTLGNTLLLQAYDTDTGPAYTTFATLTAGTTPTMDLATGVTIGSAYVYRAAGTDVALADGGTNASLVASTGGIFYSGASAGAILAGTATAGQIIRSGASAAPTWSTSTYPATNAVSTLLYASSTNVMAALATANSGVLVTSGTGVPSIATDIPTAVTIGGAYIYRAAGTDVALADGGTNASLTASVGGIFYSGASAGAILAGTATAGQIIRSGASAAPTWSTTTYPATNAVNTLLYASSANVMAALPTGNSGALVTGATGIPSIASPTVTGQFLRAGTTPTWSTTTYPATNAIGTMLYASGANVMSATNAASSGVLVTSGTGVPSILDSATDGTLLRGSTAGTPAWSTTTYPATNAVSTLLYASSANVMAALATANSGVLVTSGTGVPSIATDIPTAVTIGGAYIYRAAGTDVAVADGGTGVGTFTTNGVLYGNATTNVLVTAQGAANTVLIANAGAPSFSASPTVATSVTSPSLVATTAVTTPSIITASGALGITPASASGVNINLATTGDFAVNTTHLVVDTSAENVGIGTASPGAQIHLVGPNNAAQLIIQSPAIGALNDYSNIEFRLGAGNVQAKLGIVADVGGWPFGLTFHTAIGQNTPLERVRITSSGDVGIGSTASPSAGNGKVLFFGDNAAQPTMGSNTAGIYAYDSGGGTVEMYSVDEAGNDTLFSPHDLITGELIHRSVNKYSGRDLLILIEQLAREVERLSGKKFVVETWRPIEKRLDWNAVQEQQRLWREVEIAAWQDDLGPKPMPFVPKVMPPYIAAALGHP